MDVSPKDKLRVAVKLRTKLALITLICIGTMTALPSWAATVTTNEMGMDAIFSAPIFGSETIDIRFNSVVNHIDGTLLNLDQDAYNTLRSFYNGLYPANIVRMFFVDAINWCGNSGTYAGCAEIDGNDIFIDSDFADTSYGHVLNAHELGHNLNLLHNNGSSDNLMNSTVTDPDHTILLSSQVEVILGSSPILRSSLVQTELGTGQLYMSIIPILVSATAVVVPIPSALILCFSALGSLGLFGRGRRRQTA